VSVLESGSVTGSVSEPEPLSVSALEPLPASLAVPELESPLASVSKLVLVLVSGPPVSDPSSSKLDDP